MTKLQSFYMMATSYITSAVLAGEMDDETAGRLLRLISNVILGKEAIHLYRHDRGGWITILDLDTTIVSWDFLKEEHVMVWVDSPDAYVPHSDISFYAGQLFDGEALGTPLVKALKVALG